MGRKEPHPWDWGPRDVSAVAAGSFSKLAKTMKSQILDVL